MYSSTGIVRSVGILVIFSSFQVPFLCVPQMGSDSIVGAMCQIADKTSIKRSTIGNSTCVKEKVKVANSIIMHGVTIEEG